MPFWGVLEGSWWNLGGLFVRIRHLGSLFGPSWFSLGRSGVILGRLGVFLVASWAGPADDLEGLGLS